MQYTVFDDMTCCTEKDVQRLLTLVGKKRQQQALRFKHLFGQWTSLKACELLLQLWQLTPPLPDFEENDYGKPFLPHFPFFSISHCRAAVAVATDSRPIGIDVETIRHPSQSLVEKVMNESEQVEIANADNPDVAFIQLWTKKEAWLKLQGTGIRNDLQQTLVFDRNTPQPLFTTYVKDNAYVLTIAQAQEIQ